MLVAFLICLMVLGIATAYDAFERTDYGCVWVVLLAFFAPLTIAVYWLMRLYTDRRAPKQVLDERENQSEMLRNMRIGGEIERAKYIKAVAEGEATIYDPAAGALDTPQGYAHFTDERAEVLLRQRRYDEAWDYLIDLYAIANSEGDLRGTDTYLHYILRMPDGVRRLGSWRLQQMKDPERPPARTRRDRDVPF